MDRRTFLRTVTAAAAMPALSGVHATERKPRVMTVTGEVAADELGVMLPHEHVLVDFVGADQVSPERYDAEEVYSVMLPYLRQAKELGVGAIAECTPAYLGRDPRLLQKLSQAAGVKLLTNTGYYGAREGKFLPAHALEESANQLAERWSREFREGIEGTGARPGFIKIGVDSGPLTDVNRKLVEAAARCHRQTGLTIACHTGDGRAALAQIAVLREMGVSPAAWIWVHAQNERNLEIHLEAARAGAWIEFDGVSSSSVQRHVEAVQAMKRAGLLDRLLLSHDAGWYSVGEPRGGQVRGFDALFTELLPALRTSGLSDDDIRQVTVLNPGAAFSIAVRTA